MMGEKPDFEKMAREAAMSLPPSDYGSHRVIQNAAAQLKAAYAAGYRAGQERMRERAHLQMDDSKTWREYLECDMNIEEPPT